VEAGLRTKNKDSPFPEEINRCLTSCITDLHFPPTTVAKTNLLNEGIDAKSIWVTGNTVVDALQSISAKLNEESIHHESLDFLDAGRRTVLVTGHRRESFGPKLQEICLALKDIALTHNGVQVVYPVHLNPSVWDPVHKILGKIENIHLIYPLDYLSFVYLIKKADLIITDSGGVQEEAPSLGKYVLVTRDTTERPEGLKVGIAKLVGADKDLICEAAFDALNGNLLSPSESQKRNPYGDGQASRRIVEVLLKGKCDEFCV